MNRILVIGATGTVGRQVVAQLVARGAAVRVLVRNPAAAHLPPEVEVVRGDLTAPESLDPALAGIDALFLIWTAPAQAAAAAVDQIAHRARRIVYLSAPYKTEHPFFQTSLPNPSAALHAQIERRIETTALEWTFLRPGMFAANALGWWAPQIRAGDVVRWPYLAAPTAPIHERDIAAIAIRALCDEGHAGAEYVLTGPESLTQADQLAIIGRVTGRTPRMEEITAEEARQVWAAWPETVVNLLLAAWAASIGHPTFMTSTVADITGTPAHTFQQWATDHAADFRG